MSHDQILMAPIESYSAWQLACRLAIPSRPEHAAALRAIREELVSVRGCSADAVNEIITLARWASDVLGPKNGMVQHVIGDIDDVTMAIDFAADTRLVSPSEIERLRSVVARLS